MMRWPARAFFTPRIFAASPIIVEVSASLPTPVNPEASLPSSGSITVAPRSISVEIFFCTAGLLHMFASIAGASSSGADVAMAVMLIGSSASPSASLPIMCAVAGAIIKISPRSARATCSTASGELISHTSWCTGRWVMLRKVRGVTNCVAE